MKEWLEAIAVHRGAFILLMVGGVLMAECLIYVLHALTKLAIALRKGKED